MKIRNEIADFIKKLIDYYGHYKNKTIPRELALYLEEEKFNISELDFIYQSVKESYSGQYYYTPDVSIVKNVIDNIDFSLIENKSTQLLLEEREKLKLIKFETYIKNQSILGMFKKLVESKRFKIKKKVV